MNELFNELLSQGYSKDQVEKILLVIHEFLQDRFPVLASLSEKALHQCLNEKR